MIKKVYIVKNLHCASCSSKIEGNIKKMNIVEEVTLDFYTSELTVILKEEISDETLIPKLNFICDKVESGTYLKKIETRPDRNITTEKVKSSKNFHQYDCKCCSSPSFEHDHSHSHLHSGHKNMKGKIKINPNVNSNYSHSVEDSGSCCGDDSEESPDENIGFFSKENLTNVGVVLGILLFIASFLIDSLFIKNLILVIAYIFTGTTVVIKSLKNIKRGNFLDENFLMTIATIGAFILGDFSEAVAVMIFYMVGEYFQEKAVNNSKKSIEKLLSLKASYANLKLPSGEILKVAPEEIQIGNIITVKTGEKIPLDGIIILGETQIDNSALTGESVPVTVSAGSTVLSGGINLGGVFDIQVTTEYTNSTVNKIIELVKNAHSRKPESEKFITIFARYYTPVVVILAILIAIIPPLAFQMPFTLWIGRALIFLVISCPCALVLSIPLTFFSSIGYASKNGILIKGGNYLEALSKIDTIVFDKTGTITKGNFKVNELEVKSGTEEELIFTAKVAEYFSNHPIAKAIMEYPSSNINPEFIGNHKEIAGKGVYVEYKGDKILVGNPLLLKEEGVECPISNSFKTSIYVAKNGIFLGTILISDEIKLHAKNTVKALNEMKLSLYMLTGDSKVIAENIGAQVGLNKENIFANLLPEDKVNKLEEIKKKSKKGVIFIGDGINDAPVLSLADIGIAMGGIGSDIAIESSDVVIMNDEFEKVHQLLEIAKKNRRILTENITFALGVKFLVMTLGVLGYASLWLAIFADVGVSLLAVLNASKILKKK